MHTPSLLLIALILLATCTSPLLSSTSLPTPVPHYTVSTQQEQDQVTIQSDARNVVVDIVSPRGIGGATVTLQGAALPERITLRFHLAGLEQMTLTYGQTALTLSVLSHGEQTIIAQRLDSQGREVEQLTPQSPYWMAVQTLGQGTDDATFDVTMPVDLLTGRYEEFTVEWIDFYR